MFKIKNTQALNFIPHYTYHLDDEVMYLRDGKVMASFVIEGYPYEAVNDNEIINKFESINHILSSICKDKRVFYWTHILKTKRSIEDTYNAKGNNFLQSLYDSYVKTLGSGEFFKTQYVLSVGLPVPDNKSAEGIENSVEAMNEVINQVSTAFSAFNIKTLGINNGLSEIGKYLSYLANHKEYELPLSATEMQTSLINNDTFFGFDVFEIKNYEENTNLYGVNYLVKDFPRVTNIGHLDFLLKMPYEFVLTHSFLPIRATKALKDITQQLNKLESSGDTGESEQEELDLGRDFIQSGDTTLGNFHSVLSVFGSTPEAAKDAGIKISGEFLTAGKGFRYVKSTKESPLAFYSHLPLSKNRPLSTIRSLSNMVCMWSLHNHSYGKREGNPIGDGSAIMPLKTITDSVYYFNTHSSPIDRNVTGDKIAGHALILGATGAGKTTFEATAAAFLQRFDPSMFVIDYNRSTELFVRAFGGEYFTFEEGKYTGINPFQFGEANNETLMAFLKSWVKRCAANSDNTPITDEEGLIIDNAVNAVMRLPIQARRFATLLESLQSDSKLNFRLRKWCNNGSYAWALDSPENKFIPEKLNKIGFDTTVILESVNGEDHPACEALLSLLFFMKNEMQKEGKLMLTIVEEFWKGANYPMTQSMINASLKAGRLKGEMIWLTSQSPKDAINCEIFSAIVEQTATKICLPNPDAEYEGSYERIGLTEKEFRVLKSLGKESRTMLIKQSGSTSFAKMDLYKKGSPEDDPFGIFSPEDHWNMFDLYLPILSGTTEGITSAMKIIEKHGNNPNNWIPHFQKEQLEQKKKGKK